MYTLCIQQLITQGRHDSGTLCTLPGHAALTATSAGMQIHSPTAVYRTVPSLLLHSRASALVFAKMFDLPNPCMPPPPPTWHFPRPRVGHNRKEPPHLPFSQPSRSRRLVHRQPQHRQLQLPTPTTPTAAHVFRFLRAPLRRLPPRPHQPCSPATSLRQLVPCCVAGWLPRCLLQWKLLVESRNHT